MLGDEESLPELVWRKDGLGLCHDLLCQVQVGEGGVLGVPPGCKREELVSRVAVCW